jgi:hypothetical protein
MGFAVDAQHQLLSMSDDVNREVRWQLGFRSCSRPAGRATTDARDGGAAANAGGILRIGRALVISRGIWKPGRRCLPDADHATWGGV